jgi:hypothetical protein
MKKLLITFLLSMISLGSSAVAQNITGDASTDTKHITQSRLGGPDENGGLTMPGGNYGLPNIDVGGLSININKKALDNYRGPDLLNPCAVLGSSFLSQSPTVCNTLITVTASSIECSPGEHVDGDACVKNCPLGQHPDPANPDSCICSADQHIEGDKCKCNASNMVLDEVNGCVLASTQCLGNKVDTDGDGTCECPGGTVDKGNNICCGSDCSVVNNECVTQCPADQTDPMNTCDTDQCQESCEQYSSWNTATNQCDCNGDFVEDPDNQWNCGCPFPAVYDTNSPPENPVCKCPADQVYNSNAKECRCSGNTIPDTAPGHEGQCKACPSNSTAQIFSCSCTNASQYYDGGSNQCITCPSNSTVVGGMACKCSDSNTNWDPASNTCR